MSPTYSVTRQFSQTFTSNGTFIVPTFTYEVFVVGCGGGAGGCGFNLELVTNERTTGGKGAAVKGISVSVSPFESISVTIGAGGAGGAYQASGSAGSDSLFGAYATFPGASAPPYFTYYVGPPLRLRNLSSSGLTPGAMPGVCEIPPEAGQDSPYASGGAVGSGVTTPGAGGGASYGAGGNGGGVGHHQGYPAGANTGGGGGSGSSGGTDGSGGAGGSGIIIVYWNSIRAP